MLSRALRGAAPLGLSVLVALGARADEVAPFRIRNLNPLVAIFGLPAWDVPTAGTRFDATLEVANHYRLSARDGERLILDGETLRTTVSYSRSVGARWSVGFELPHYRISGGELDDLIDGWHSVFGMPDGGRNARPEDALLFEIGSRAAPFFRLDRERSGLGDVQLKIARELGGDRPFVLQGTVKLPAGDEDLLTGSGSADVGLTLLRVRPATVRDRAASVFWGAGVLHAGDAERFALRTENVVPVGIVGGSWQVWPRVGIKGQIDFHGSFFDSALEEIGEDAIQVTAGAWFRPGRRAWLELAIVEDLAVSTAPDIVLHFAAHWAW